MPHSKPVQSVNRALELLELLTREVAGLTLDELSERTGLNKTTAHNLLRTLRERGYVEQSVNRRFLMGGMVQELWLGRERSECFRRAEAAVRALHGLNPKATVNFCERTGSEISCRLRMSGDRPGVLQRPRSQFVSPYTSASGLCFQAFSPNYRELMAVAHPLEEQRQGMWASPEAFKAAMAETVARGVAVIRVGNFLRIAAPVSDIFSLAMQMENPGKSVDSFCDDLRKAAGTISASGDLLCGKASETITPKKKSTP